MQRRLMPEKTPKRQHPVASQLFTGDLCLISIRQIHASEEALMSQDKQPDAVCKLHADAYTLRLHVPI
jgi:hypothetical protein